MSAKLEFLIHKQAGNDIIKDNLIIPAKSRPNFVLSVEILILIWVFMFLRGYLNTSKFDRGKLVRNYFD